MMQKQAIYGLLFLLGVTLLTPSAQARRRGRRHYGPPPTHPVLLWSRTLSESGDREQRKIAAFKLSQYSQTIYQDEVIKTLTKCIKDPDTEIKVLCTKAMGRAGTQSRTDVIRNTLLEQYQSDPMLRNTIVRVFIIRQDNSVMVHDTFLDSLKKSQDVEEQLALLKYFETYGLGSNRFADTLVDVYNKSDNLKVKNAVVTALAARAEGQNAAIALLAQCTESHETPLVLNCLSGLQQQAKKDSRAWSAVEKTIQSEDPDVVMATLDVIAALPETPNVKIATRLIKLIEDVDDEDTLEKAILSLGVCGDQSQAIVTTLQKLMDKKSTAEGIRIAAALVLGKQGGAFPEKPKEQLLACSKGGASQSLRTACQLGLKELEARAALTTAKEAKEAAAAAPANKDAKDKEAAPRQPTEATGNTATSPKSGS